ncbi:MAG: hypothetical protein AB7F35_06560 [Acetobacteraceae bacterium]
MSAAITGSADQLMLLPPSALLSAGEKAAIAREKQQAEKAEAAATAARVAPWYPRCATCQRPVDRVEFTCDPATLRVAVTMICHGQSTPVPAWGEGR